MSNFFKGTPLTGSKSTSAGMKDIDHTSELIVDISDNDGVVVGDVSNQETTINVELVQQGQDGAGIEFVWRGTELGLRVEGDTEYTYMDLTSGMSIDRGVLITTLGFEPAQADLLQKHLDDLSKHITPEERIRWNEGVNVEEIYKRISDVENGTVGIKEYELHVQDSFSMMDEMRGNLVDAINTFNKSISDLNEAKADRLKVIEQLDGKANKIHNHDVLYASKIELDEKIKALELVIPAKISELEDDIEIVTMEFLESLKLNDAYDDIEKLKLEKAALSFVNEQVLNLQKQIDAITSSISEGDIAQIKESIINLKANKVDKIEGKGLSSNDLTNILYEKLLSVEKGANNYKHPDTHSAEMIAETPNKRFVSDFQKDLWNNKADKASIPTKTSQLVNDSGYATLDDIPNLSGEFEKINAQLSVLGDTKLSKAEHKVAIAKLQTQIDNIDIPEETLNAINEQISKLDVDKADKSELVKEVSRLEELIANISVPTKVSELVNDAGYITSADKSITALKGDIEELKLNKADNIKLTSEIARVESIISGLDIPEEVDLTPITKAITQLETGKLSIVEFEKRLSEEILALIGEAPETLDTLGELAKALGEDPNFATTMTNMIAKKVSTDVYNAKIAEIEDTIENLDIPEGVDLRPVYAAIEKLKAETVQLTDFNEQISKLATISSVTEQLALKADKSELPSKLSELLNDVGFITKSEIPAVDLEPLKTDISELRTEKADKASIPTKLSQLANDSGYIKIEDVPETDLTPIETRLTNVEQSKANKTDIPTKVGQLTNDKGYITLAQVPEVDLTPINTEINTLKETKANQATLDNAIKGVNLELAKKALKTDIPTMLSQLTNDSKFITLADVPVVDLEPLKKSISAIDTAKADKSYVNTQIESVNAEIVKKANKEDVPTKVSQLSNDKGYITLAQVPPTDLSSIESSIESININKADKSELPAKLSELKNDTNFITIEDVPEIDLTDVEDKIEVNKENIKVLQDTKANKVELPTKVGELINDKGFITLEQVPKVDLTEINKELEHLGSTKANKDELPTALTELINDAGFITMKDVPEVDLSGVQNDISKLQTDKADKSQTYTKLDVDGKLEAKADKVELPTSLSELKNDTNFITIEDVPKVDLTPLEGKVSKLETDKASKIELSEGLATKAEKAHNHDTLYYKQSQMDSKLNAKQDKLGYTPENQDNKGIPDGYVPLDAKGRVPLQYIPDIAKQQTYVVENKADMDKLTGLIMGEKCYVTSLGDSYIWNGAEWQVLSKADWENVNLDWENITNRPKSSQTQIDGAVTDSHKHANKTVLDKITDAMLSKIEQAFNHISDAIKHITGEERKLWNTVSNKADKTELTTHTSNASNPHKVTKGQVGLGNVDNTSDANKPVSVATQKALDIKANKADVTASLELKANKTDVPTKVSQLSNDSKFITLAEVPEVDLSPINNDITKLQSGKADKTELNSHTGSKDNPHSVTKEQIGLGNVNNTTDLDKPISSKTQEALDSKVSLKGDTMTGKLIIDASIFETEFTGQNINIINKMSGSGGWARSLLTLKNEKESLMSIGGKGGGQDLQYMYIGKEWDDNLIRFYKDGQIRMYGENVLIGNRNILQELDKKADQASLDTHTNNKSNPHNVTKAQLNLGNVDNTADIDKPISTATQTALNGKVDNSRVLTDVPANAKFTDTIYTHPSTHPASMITESATRRFVSDTEKATWNSKGVVNIGTFNSQQELIGYVLMKRLPTGQYVFLMNGYSYFMLLRDWGNYYKGVFQDNQGKFIFFQVTKTGVLDELIEVDMRNILLIDYIFDDIATLNSNKVDNSRVLTDVPPNAKFTDTIYTHPSNHPASMITESTTKRFVSDTEKNSWNSKADKTEIPTKITDLTDDIGINKITDTTTNTQYKIIMENGIPYFEEI